MATCKGPGKKPGTRCGQTARAKDLCFSHYRQQLRRGEGAPLTPLGSRPVKLEVLEGTNLRLEPELARRIRSAAARRKQTPYETVRDALEAFDFVAMPTDASAAIAASVGPG
jgi:hypothetical protein